MQTCGRSEQIVIMRSSDHPEFFGFTNWQEVLEFVESGEGDHLITLVNILGNFSEKQLMWALNRCVEKPEDADVVISTAHRAKGLEWNSVQLAPGFLNSKQRKHIEASELRLFYVAMTRGRIGLDVAPETLMSLRTMQMPVLA